MLWRRLLQVLGLVQGRRVPALRKVAGGRVIDDTAVEQLRAQVIRLLRSRPLDYLPVSPVKIEPVGPGVHHFGEDLDFHAIEIHMPGLGPQLINATNMYLTLQGHHTDPRAVHQYLIERMRGFADPLAIADVGLTAAAPDLLIRLFPQDDDRVLSLPWGDLYASIVHDQPHNMAYLSVSIAQEWGAQPEDLFAVALRNLEQRYGATRAEPLHPGSAGPFNVWTVAADPCYNASLVLLPDVVDTVPLPRDEMFVMIPQRDRLFFVEKPATAEGRLALLQIAFEMHHDGAYMIAPYLYVWSGDRLRIAAAEEILGSPLPPGHDGCIILKHPQTEELIALRLPLAGHQPH